MQTFTCPACQKQYRWKPETAGKKVRCKCGHAMVVPTSGAPAVSQSPSKPSSSRPSSKPAAPPRPQQQSPDDMAALQMALDAPDASASYGSAAQPGRSSSAAPAAPRRCPNCGQGVSAQAVLCVNCGTNLAAGGRAPAAAVAAEPDTGKRFNDTLVMWAVGVLGLVAIIGVALYTVANPSGDADGETERELSRAGVKDADNDAVRDETNRGRSKAGGKDADADGGRGATNPDLPRDGAKDADTGGVGGERVSNDGMPIAPFQISQPRSPDSSYKGKDLNEYEPDQVADIGDRLLAEGDYSTAAQLQHWAVNHGAGSEYNTACAYSRSGDQDAAIYFIQRAAVDEGVDSVWANQDPDLASLRADPRWGRLVRFLNLCNDYWQRRGTPQTIVVTPRGYDGQSPLPVVMGLHGMGHNAEGFLTPPDLYQTMANRLNVAFVGVSGTVQRGRSTFVWATHTPTDKQRIQAALKTVGEQVNVDKDRVVLFGFSQGAHVATALATQDPELFAGAISLSPGGDNNMPVDFGNKRELLHERRFVISVGAGEHPGNVALAQRTAEKLERLGASVTLRVVQVQRRHAMPGDWYEVLPKWVDYILKR